MRLRPAYLLAAALAAISPIAAGAQRAEGLAYPAAGGPLVYREVHWLYRDAGVPARVVLYRCPDGRPFARKTMRASPSAIAPVFDFIDARTGYREGLRVRGGVTEVYWQPDARTPLRTRTIAATGEFVADAGFDAFVRTRWDAIAQRAQVVPFLIPSHFGTLDFRVRDAGATAVQGRPARRLRMGLAGLLGLALPDVELVYDAVDRRLVRFIGPGTVRDPRGRLQTLRVEFPAPPVDDVPMREVDDARAATLVASCAR